jgi:thiol-disulfide isomerase/thioredoxin
MPGDVMPRRPVVVMYGKPNCSLCDAAMGLLRDLQRETPFEIESIDITADPDLFARYREAIPVICLEGVEIARGRVSQSAARSAISRALDGLR